MANGQQIAGQNFATFVAWLASKSIDEFRAMTSRGVLSRKEIAKECGFAQSALTQNPRIKAALKAKEDELRAGGVLPSLAPKVSDAEGELPLRESGRRDGKREQKSGEAGGKANHGFSRMRWREALSHSRLGKFLLQTRSHRRRHEA